MATKFSGDARISSAISNFQRMTILRKMGKMPGSWASFTPFPVLFRISRSAPICAGVRKLMRIQEMLEMREVRNFSSMFWISAGAIFPRWGSEMGGNWAKNGQFPVVFWVFLGVDLWDGPECCWRCANFLRYLNSHRLHILRRVIKNAWELSGNSQFAVGFRLSGSAQICEWVKNCCEFRKCWEFGKFANFQRCFEFPVAQYSPEGTRKWAEIG